MNIKTLILAALLSLSFPLATKAETGIKSQRDRFNISQTNSFPVNMVGNEDRVSQRTKARRTRRGNKLKKLYFGGTLGFFFPSNIDDGLNIDPGTGVGGSLYAGYRFSSFISADLEVLRFGGDAKVPDTDAFDDSSYSSFGVFANPRFTFVFDKNNINKSIYAFFSPGLGINRVGFGGDIEDDLDDGDVDTSGTGLALQLKGGVGFPLSKTIDIFGQARYLTTFNIYTESDDDITENQDFSSIGLEFGVNLKI